MGEPTIYKPSIYKGNGIYKNGGGGGGGDEYELVFYTNFANLSNGIDTPIIGEQITTDFSQQINVSTPVNATTAAKSTSSPSGYKKLLNLSSYISSAKKVKLHYLVNSKPNNSYCTLNHVISNAPGILFQTTSGGIRVQTSDTSIIKVPFNGSNPISLVRFVHDYTVDRWAAIDLQIDYIQNKLQLYIYGILVYEKSHSSKNLEIGSSLFDSCEMAFTDVQLYVK